MHGYLWIFIVNLGFLCMVSYGCCLLFEDYYKYSVMSYGFVNLGFLWFLMDIVCELTIIINI